MEKCPPTDDHVEGPFYRPGAPDVTDLYPPDSTGPVLWFTGSVSNTDCRPLAGAVIEVWQADDRGRYDNDGPGCEATEIRCRARMTADCEGRFAFRTVLPANYPVPGETWMRVKHLHFKLFAPCSQPLTTEIELLPDEHTGSDQLYNPRLAVTLQKEESDECGAPEYRVHFDFVLRAVSASGYAIAARSSGRAEPQASSASGHEPQGEAPRSPIQLRGEALTTSPFVGTWTYRSFHDKPEEVEDFNDIRLWQATLTLEADGPDLVKGRIGSGGYDLDVRGSASTKDGVPSLALRAVGIPGTPTAGWVYDYAGVLAHPWPDADKQRPAIVGTVIRTVPHSPDRPAGLTYSFVAVNKTTPAPTYQLPPRVTAHFADRVHRLHHAVWHGIRSTWNAMSKSEQEMIANLDWRIPGDRIVLASPGERTRPSVTNGAGEDFLFFHRQMVVQYKKLMAEASAPPIEWPEIPQPGAVEPADPTRPTNPVPPEWAIASFPHVERRFAVVKSDSFFWSRMRWWDYQFKDPTYLASLTLGELGALIEFSVHNDMHIRWSEAPRDPETNALLQLGRPDDDISPRWDDPRYDWLGEFYSSHVNPLFWRLHGWIDDRIEDWYAAHQWKHRGQVKRAQKGGVRWFSPGDWVQVEHPWVWPESLGGYEHAHDGHDPLLRARRIASAEKVMAILFPPLVRIGAAEVRDPTRTSVIGL